mmetsp:Transcript_8531/g.22042  ORF Transcript_8531/g.22042 Transcript_8531/m.22042 type:complete len:206 (+) Transcript_8531:275-892(+)
MKSLALAVSFLSALDFASPGNVRLLGFVSWCRGLLGGGTGAPAACLVERVSRAGAAEPTPPADACTTGARWRASRLASGRSADLSRTCLGSGSGACAATCRVRGPGSEMAASACAGSCTGSGSTSTSGLMVSPPPVLEADSATLAGSAVAAALVGTEGARVSGGRLKGGGAWTIRRTYTSLGGGCASGGIGASDERTTNSSRCST